jgi:exodeoxyribonuclease V alpha subunit
MDDLESLRREVVTSAEVITAAALAGDADGALAGLELHRLLCAHREGPYGVTTWAQHAVEWITAASVMRPGEAPRLPLRPARTRAPSGSWFPGQPLLVTVNDYETKIYNGDTGVVIAVDDGDGVTAAFRRTDGAFRIHPSRLPDLQTVYAMTIHRSQGSQYDTVSVVLPGEESALLTRELFYTAITRAKSRVRVIGSRESVRAGVERQVSRASGLRRTFR